MPVLHVRVISHRDVSRASFILSALGQSKDKVPVNNEYLEQVKIDGQNILVRVTERVLEPGVLKDLKGMSEWGKRWDQSPDRVDGALVLYDVTNSATIEGLPTALRSYGGAGVPNILVSIGHDSDKPAMINQEIFNKKATIWNKGNKDRMVFQASPADRSSAACFNSLLRDILRGQSEEDRLLTTSRPSTASSSKRNDSVPSLVKHGRSSSSYSTSSSKDQDPAHDTLPPPSPTPRPKLAAQAARQNSTSDGDLKADEADARDLLRRESSMMDESDASMAATLNEDADDERDAAILTTQQTYGQNVATFDELVDKLVRPFQSPSDAKFVDRFLAFYRMFASPHRLLDAVIARCLRPSSPGSISGDKQQERVEQVFRILSVWIKRYPGDFALEKTADKLDEFLRFFESEDADYLTENIRVALDDVEETDDTGWGTTDETVAAASSSSVTLGSSHSSNRPTSPPQSSRASRATSTLVDDSYIFKTGAVTLNAMGPSTDTASLTSARTKEKISEQAQRKAVLLVPNPRFELTKDRWRQFLEIAEIDIAEELTRIDWIMFSSIKPRDLIRDVTVSLSKRERFRDLANVSRMIDHFNHVAYWTTNLVLLRDKPKHRAQMWLKLARVARELRKLNSYNSLGAIVAGMEGTAIHRLAATKALISDADQRDFIKIQILMSTSRGHFAYRMAWDNTSGPRLPFLPLHRRDLVVAEQGNKSMVTRTTKEGKTIKLINWTKFDIMGSIVTDFQKAQTTAPRSFRGSDTVRALLLNCMIKKDDDELYERSVALEPTQGSGSTSKGPGASARRRLQPWLVRYGLTQAA